MAQIWELPWPNSLQQLNLEYEMHFEVILLQLLRALLDIRVHLRKVILLKICVSVGYLKSQFEIVVRKKEKLAQLLMLERIQTEEKRSSCIEGWVSTCIGDGHQDSIRENLLEWKAIQ